MALEERSFNIGAFDDSVANGDNYVANYLYQVFNTNNTLASIFSDPEGNIPILQNGISNKSDSIGGVKFYIESGSYYIQAGSTRINFDTDNVGDLSQAYIFETVADYQASTLVFPLGKTIHLNDRGANFTVSSGVNGADGYGVISNTNTTQKATYSEDFITAQGFGAGIAGSSDDTNALIAAHNTQKSVYYGSNSYVVKNANQILIFDGCKYWGDGCEITVPEGAEIPNPTSAFGRFENSIFYRGSSSSLSDDITITGFNIKISSRGYNFIGGETIPLALVESSLGSLKISKNTLKNAGTLPNLGGPLVATHNAGSLCQLNGYPVVISSNDVHDCSNGIVSFNSKYADIHDNNIYYSGVSRDFTTWTNSASILIRGSVIQNVKNNLSFVTGGTSFFLSAGGASLVEVVEVMDNVLIGCGLSAIGLGARNYVTTKQEIKSIKAINNNVIGFCCCIDADSHGGININMQNGLDSYIRQLETRNSINYLAPWESFNYDTGEVDGSYNLKKKKGGNVGSQYGLSIIADVDTSIMEARCFDSVSDHQAAGFLFLGVDDVDATIKVNNCGWQRDLSNDPIGIQSGVYAQGVKLLKLNVKTNNTCYSVNESDPFCTPITINDVSESFLYSLHTKSNNQRRALRVITIDGSSVINIEKCDFDKTQDDGGFKYFLDDLNSQEAKDTTVLYSGKNNTAIATGSRTLPVGTDYVYHSILAPITISLLKARHYKESKITFKGSPSGNNTTISASTGELISGSASYTLPPNEYVTLYSNGLEWEVL